MSLSMLRTVTSSLELQPSTREPEDVESQEAAHAETLERTLRYASAQSQGCFSKVSLVYR